jgi:hypothetical protein
MQVRIMDRRSEQLLRVLRVLQQTDTSAQRLGFAAGDVGEEAAQADGKSRFEVESESDDEVIEDHIDVVERLQGLEVAGEIYFYLLLAKVAGRNFDTRIQVNVSQVLQLHLLPPGFKKQPLWQGFREYPVWTHVQEKVSEATGHVNFTYSFRPGAQLTVVTERDFLLLVRVWLRMLRVKGQETVRIEPYTPEEGEFDIVEVQRRARFNDKRWLTKAFLPGSVTSYISDKDGSLGPFVSAYKGSVSGSIAAGDSYGALQRSFEGLSIEFPKQNRAGDTLSEICGGDRNIIISKCQQASAISRTILGRVVRVVVLESAEAEGEELPVCEVRVPVLPDGSSAVRFEDFCATVNNRAGESGMTLYFTYVPAPSTRGTYAPWCLKTAPDAPISQVEDELEHGVSAYSVKLRMVRLERLARYASLSKGRKGCPVLMELTLVHKEMSIYSDEAERSKFCTLLAEVIAQKVKLKVKLKAGNTDPESKKQGKEDDVLKPGQCELVDAMEVQEVGVRGVWLVVRYGVESPEHAKAFVRELQDATLLHALEDAVSAKVSKTDEEKPRSKTATVLARLNSMAPAVAAAAVIEEELAMLRAYLTNSAHFELFRWRGITLRYKGSRPWAKRHEPDVGRYQPYYYVDHDTEQTLYSSAGLSYIEDDMDFKEAVQNVIHREAFKSTAAGDFVLYLTLVKGYSLVVRSVHPDLEIDRVVIDTIQGSKAGRSSGLKVGISVDATFQEARAALRRALGASVFFSYVYKAEVKLALRIKKLQGLDTAQYAVYELVLLASIRMLLEMTPEEWKGKIRKRQKEQETQGTEIYLRVCDVPIWKAEQLMQSLVLDAVRDDQRSQAPSPDDIKSYEIGKGQETGINITGSHVDSRETVAPAINRDEEQRRKLALLKSRILERMQAQLQGGVGEVSGAPQDASSALSGAVEFFDTNLHLSALPVITKHEQIVDHDEEFEQAMQILSEDPAMQRTLQV